MMPALLLTNKQVEQNYKKAPLDEQGFFITFYFLNGGFTT